MPAGGLIGQAVLDDESHRDGNDTVRVERLGQGILGRVRVKEPIASGAAMLRVDELEITRSARNEVAQVM
jgi:hypothetical protein